MKIRNLKITILICVCCSFVITGYSQLDSTLLDLDKLHWEDIKFEKKRLLDVVISGSRTTEQRKDVTDKVYVITRQEIIDNGYYTLIDALSSLPGIRTSQPGSAQEGEIFYMRGLLGNTYAKILINDVPIKSFVSKSMGISSQLPIRQVERIEVIYGTKASIYGVDASVGIINIVLPQGKNLIDEDFNIDIGFGSNNLRRVNFFSSNNFRIKKKLLSTSIYGGYTQFEDWDIEPKGDTSLYRLDNYIQTTIVDSSGIEIDTILSFLPHYDRDNYEGTEEFPALGNLPGKSNYLGMSANYGAFTSGILYTSRQDHTSIGRSPIYTTYYNALNYYKENTLSLNLSFKKQWSKIGVTSNINYLDYEIDPESNENKISIPFLEIIDGANGDFSDIALRTYERYVKGTKYSAAFSNELEFDQLLYYTFNKNLNSVVGAKYKRGSGTPISSFYSDSDLAAASIDARTGDYQLYSVFIQNSINFSKLKVDLGLHYSYYDIPELRPELDSLLVRDNLSFQISALYNINKTSQLRFRSGTAFRIPSPYYKSQSFSAQPGGLRSLNLIPEYAYSGELVYSWYPDDSWSLDLSSYWSRKKNLISFRRQIDSLTMIPELVYANEENNQIELWGIQAHLRVKNLHLPLNSSFDLMLNLVQGHETNNLEPLIGEGKTFSEVVYPGLQGFPKFMVQFNPTFNLFEDLQIKLFNTFNSRTLAVGQFINRSLKEFIYSNSFYRLNIQMNYNMTPKLSLGARINNVIDTDYAGIDATDQLENLLYNPQPRRNFFFSLNYSLNNR